MPTIRVLVYERHPRKFDTDLVAFIMNDVETGVTEFVISGELTRDTHDIIDSTIKIKTKRLVESLEATIMDRLSKANNNQPFAAFFESLGVPDFVPVRMHTYYVFDEWHERFDIDNPQEFIDYLMTDVVKKLYYPYDFLRFLH